ncbi:MAG TPA: cytochrome ubiquinol oxidase subunit I [Candidatus Binataceae bacterium]|nr:cytochrome ubiquinol oxidase subunit I [Candidatus Binataceae bacterium]
MDPLLASRIQFGFTIAFHYLFPPLSIGLGVVMVAMETAWVMSGRAIYREATRFWARIFGLTFAMGVATGIVMEFQFGTNWGNYSRFVGDVFGSILAAEGLFAFFLESGALALVLFGWERLSPKLHLLATIMVCLGAHFSAVWIIIANSWMQTPAGYRIVQGDGPVHAVVTDFTAVLLNPSFLTRLTHTIFGAWNSGAFLVLSVSAWYLLRREHKEFAWLSFRLGLVFAALALSASILTGDASAREVAHDQPTKMAAMEGIFPSDQPEGLHLFGWVDMEAKKVYGVEIPHLLSLLTYHSYDAPVRGLESFPPKDWPPVQATFQCFHLMVGIGFALTGLVMAALFFWWRGILFEQRWLLWLMVPSVLGPELAGEFGWMTNELGRQPWLVYGLLRTSEGVSQLAHPRDVWISISLFVIVYALLLALFIFLLIEKIRHGPVDMPLVPVEEGRRASA